jgi:hypothetical protein
VSTEHITPEAVIAAMTFETVSAEGEIVATPPPETFTATFIAAVRQLEFAELRQLVKFVTSSPAIQRESTKLHIIAKTYSSSAKCDPSSAVEARAQFVEALRGWPTYPLPRAATCFSQLFVPYFDNEDAQQCGVAARWSLDTLLQVLKNMLAYKGEEFSDA